MFVEAHGGSVDAGYCERKGIVAPAARRLDGVFHQGAADAGGPGTGHHVFWAAWSTVRRTVEVEHHADGTFAVAGRTRKEASGKN